MSTAPPAALGRKRPLLNVETKRLHLDPANPRLPENIQGKGEDDLMSHLLSHFDLEELSLSMGQNGYFDEEPLVAIPRNLPAAIQPKPGEPATPDYIAFINHGDTEFTVVEGNRRLATVRILLEADTRQALKVRNWPELTHEIRTDLELLPVIVYPTRKEVLPYLGVRHITGNKKWDSYAKARYIAAMIAEGYTVEDIEKEVGDRSQGVLKNAISYKLLGTC
jgi:hypothetical protein